MKKFLIILIIVIIVSIGCSNETEKDDVKKNYLKCTQVCASVLDDDYITMHLCNEECKKQFNWS